MGKKTNRTGVRGICCKCLKEKEDITIGHIVPRWLEQRYKLLFPRLELDLMDNKRYICGTCNEVEGGGVVYTEEVGLNFLLDLRDEINRVINKQYGVESKRGSF